MGRARLLSVVISIACSFGQAADSRWLQERFAENFHRLYQPRRCGENALNFLRLVREHAGEASSLSLVTLENKGFTVFGMVNAEMARGERGGRPVAGESNWYHHVFVVDDSGLVYDFDFSAEPNVLPIADYLESMYLDEPECEKPVYGEFCGGRENKLADYELTAVNGEEILSHERPRQRKFRLKEVLRNWRVLRSP